MILPVERGRHWLCAPLFLICIAASAQAQDSVPQVGREVAIPFHLQDGDEFTTSIHRLIQYGEKLFNAKFDALTADQRSAIIEFLKSLQVLPSGSLPS